MIYIETILEPRKEEEISLVSISLMRLEEKNNDNEYAYNYGGWWVNKEKDKKYFTGKVWSKRENTILELMGKIINDINKTSVSY